MINNFKKNNQYLKYINLSFQLFALLLFSGVIGKFLDLYFKFDFPLLIFFLPLISFFAYLYRLYWFLIK